MKKLCLVLLIFLFAGCSGSDHIDRLIPNEALTGALPNPGPVNIEEQRGKSVNGGFLVNAQVLVPFDIKRDQVRPTLLAAVKTLKKRYPDCEWIVVFLTLQESLDKYTLYAGRAEYTKDGIDITYWIPSQQQLAEQKNPSEENSADPLFAGLDFADWEPVKPLTGEEFIFAVKTAGIYGKLSKKVQDDVAAAAMGNRDNYSETYRKGMENFENRVFDLTAKELGASVAEVKRAQRKLVYYSPEWGAERITVE